MINDDQITRAKQIDLPHLLRKKGFDLISTNNGSSFKCKCPFHNDVDPSLNLSFKQGLWLWNCFGCGVGGSVIDFVMRYDQIEFKEAVKILIPETTKFPNQIRKPKEIIITDEERIKLLGIASNHYHKILTNGDTKGKAYLEKRGLLDFDLINAFKIGFSDGKAKHELKEYRKDMKEKLHLFDESYYEPFANCVIFPVIDQENKVTDLYGRRIITYNTRTNHCYNHGRHLGIFNINNVKNSETVILTESIIDALSIYKAGFKNVTSLFGTNGFTKAHHSLFSNLKIKNVVLALDNDEAGQKAIQHLKEKLSSYNLNISTVNFPENIKDANDMLVKKGEEDLKCLIQNAISIQKDNSEFIQQSYRFTDYSEGSSQGKIQNLELEKSSPPVLSNEDLKVNFTFERNDLVYKSPELHFTVRNVLSLKNIDQTLRLITTVKNEKQFYTDRIDYYLSRSRKGFATSVSKEFDIQPALISAYLVDIMSFIEEDFLRRKESENKTNQKELSEIEKEEGLTFLTSKNLLKEVLDDLNTLGYVGEEANKLLLYMGGTSRKQKKPINILIRSQSSSGKSFLIDTICSLMPEEDVMPLTSITAQALYYLPEDGLKHKFIAIDEKHGADDCEYPIRSLQSGGKLSRAVTMKNPSTGKMQTEYVVKEGPVSYVDGSTDTNTNPENANRCFEMFLDETEIQTLAVQNQQKKTYTVEGMLNEDKKRDIRRKHQNAQRLLKQIKVVIPYVYKIDFPFEWIRNRRDHDRFLSLISTVTFLHQYQRDHSNINGIEYVVSTIYDYEVAYKIASTVLFNTFRELEKPLFDFYLRLQEMVKTLANKNNIELEEVWFTRKLIRANLRIEDYLLKRYVKQLKDLEYFTVKSNGNGSKDQYKLATKVNKDVMLKGLTTPEELREKLNVEKEGEKKSA